MDFRDYDPMMARWLGIDPVTHFDQSPYNAFDGNPVSIADPSGADGEPINTWHYAGGNQMFTGAGNFSSGDHMFGGSGNNFWMSQGLTTGGEVSSPVSQRVWVPGTGPETPGEITVYSGHWVTVQVIGNSLVDKLSSLASDIVAPFLEVGQDFFFPIINQFNIGFKEGIHEGRAYNSNNVVFPRTYQFENWHFVEGNSLSSTGNPTWEEGQRTLNNVISLVSNGIILVNNKTINEVLKFIGQEGIKSGMQSIKSN